MKQKFWKLLANCLKIADEVVQIGSIEIACIIHQHYTSYSEPPKVYGYLWQAGKLWSDARTILKEDANKVDSIEKYWMIAVCNCWSVDGTPPQSEDW